MCISFRPVGSIQLLLLAVLPLYCQTTGSIGGSVLDPSGAPAHGVTVTVRDTLTGVTRSTETDASGNYFIPQLYPGAFDATATGRGFDGRSRNRIVVDAGRALRIDFALQLGESHESVQVTAEAPLVDPGATITTQTVTQAQYASLPLNGRDVFQLVTQQPGVSIQQTAKRGQLFGNAVKLTVNGARSTSQSFLLDGLRINDAAGSSPASASGGLLGVESIRELKLLPNPDSAEYGNAAGAVLTIVSKSGTNAFHGSAYEYLRNSWFDARNFFDRADQRIPRLQRNQFGGVLGGPLRRDRLFFFTNYEGVREGAGTTLRPAVPTAAARNGDLPGRQVPVSPLIKPFLGIYPLPNGRDLGTGAAEYVHEALRVSGENFGVAKIDYIIRPSLRLTGRYNHLNARQTVPDSLEVFQLNNDAGMQLANLQLQQILSPRTIHSFRAGFSRILLLETAAQQPRVPSSATFIANRGFGTMAVVGLEEVGGLSVRGRPRRNITNTFQLNDEWTHIQGRHSLRFGGGLDHAQFNQVADIAALGFYQFPSLTDFLNAAPNQAQVMLPTADTARGWRLNQVYGYLQEEFRTRRFTAGIGVRYEFASTPTEVNGKVANIRNWLTDPKPTAGGPLWRNPSHRNFAPRASLSWDPFGNGRTVIRTGAGIFYDLLGVRDVQVTGVRVPPYFLRVTFQRPAFPDILAAAQLAAPPTDLDTTDYNLQQPYVGQWHLSVERQLGAATMIRMTYSGSRGIHLISQMTEANPLRPVQQADGRLFFPQGGARLNPALGAVTLRRTQFNSFYEGLNFNVERKLRSGVRFQTAYTWGKSIDESSGSVTADFDSADRIPTMFDYRQNRGRSDYDIRHVFTGNLSWMIPRKVLRGWELHALSRIQSGSAFSPFVGFDRARLTGGILDLGQRPNLIGEPRILGDPSRYFDPTAYGLPDPGYYGNLGRNTLSGPGIVNIDAAVHKSFAITETSTLKLRLEMFNVANHANLNVPSALTLFDNTGQRLGTSGRITATSTSSRQLQLALRYEF